MGQFINNPSTFVRAYGMNPAVDPGEFMRKQEFDAGVSGRAPVSHSHDADDVDGLTDAVLQIIQEVTTDSSTIRWDREPASFVPNVVLTPNSGLAVDELNDGLYVDFGSGTNQAARGDHTHAGLHDAVTIEPSQTISATLVNQDLSLEVRIRPNGGLVASGDGSGVAFDFGTGTNQVARGDHTHAQLHDAVTKQDSNSIAFTLTGQQITGSVRRRSTFALGQGAILEDSSGLYMSLGESGTQAAPGNHVHADASETVSGFLSPELYRKLLNTVDLVQVDQNILFSSHDTLTGSGTEHVGARYRFGQAMECVHLDLTAAGGSSEVTLGLEIDGSVVDSITVPASSQHVEVVNFKSLSDVFVGADKYIRIIAQSGLDTVDIQNNPARLNVTVGLRPALVSIAEIRINSGGSAASPFAADGYYSGGITASTATACNTTGVSNPAPQSVYKSIRRVTNIDPIVYAVTGLARGIDYTVRLHFNQWLFTGIDDEVFHIRVIGSSTQSELNWDTIEKAGGANKAAIKEFTAQADASGQIQIRLEPQAGNGGAYGCSICGIELIPDV